MLSANGRTLLTMVGALSLLLSFLHSPFRYAYDSKISENPISAQVVEDLLASLPFE